MSRGLTFWTDETIRLIRENFVAVSVPTWVAKAPGPEGDFLRQAGIDKRWVTSSGYMHCISASGRFLGTRPSDAVLQTFNELPAAERAPGAVRVGELAASEQSIPSPPEDGMVLRVHARFLARDDTGTLRHARTADFPLMIPKPKVLRSWALFLQPNTEYMWLTHDEWRALVPSRPVKGQRLDVDQALAMRMARFHLTPQRATTSEGGIIHPKLVKEARLGLKVVSVTPQSIRMELAGRIHWGSDYEPGKATTPNGPLAQGFASAIEGRLEYDRKTNVFTRFDIVAPGDTWGRWGDANRKSMYVERPGRSPFGFAFERADGKRSTDRIPPGGNSRYVTGRTGYFPDPGKHP